MCVHVIFSSLGVDEWPPFEKELFTLLIIRSLCILTICNFDYVPFCFRAGFGS